MISWNFTYLKRKMSPFLDQEVVVIRYAYLKNAIFFFSNANFYFALVVLLNLIIRVNLVVSTWMKVIIFYKYWFELLLLAIYFIGFFLNITLR